MRKSLLGCLGFFISLHTGFLCAMIVDSRYLPLQQKPFYSVYNQPSHVSASLFAATADRAFLKNDKFTGIPEIYGIIDTNSGMTEHSSLDVNILGQALEAVGLSNPLGQLKGLALPYKQEGGMHAQGALFAYHQQLHEYVSCGASMLFMRFLSTQRYYLDANATTRISGTALQFVDTVDQARREMFQELSLDAPASHQSGIGDIAAYLRAGNTWDYVLKCKAITFGGSVGVLIPSGNKKSIMSPASISFGGDGHWGMYTALDFESEVKEHWKVGLLGWFGKRFARDSRQRLSVRGEPMHLGATVGTVRINPGCTGSISPYVTVENLRAGFGLRAQYTVTKHGKDSWKVLCKDNNVEPFCLMSHGHKQLLGEYISRWGSDYLTLDAFYDFGNAKAERNFDLFFFVSCDIPIDGIAANAVPRTYKVSLGFDISF